MVTDLPAGTWVRVRNARFPGGFEYGQLEWVGAHVDRYGEHPAEMCWVVGPLPPEGATVHRAVWKGNSLESRGTFTYKRD